MRGQESSDTFQGKGECTISQILRFAQDDVMAEVKEVKIVKEFPAVLQKTSYVASKGSKKMKIFPSVFQIFAYVASRRH